MRLRLAYLIQAVFAVLVAGALSFGASRAMASSEVALKTCPAKGYDYPYSPCATGCPTGRGYCSAGGICQCGDLP
ncbi:MAG TPA: hypothetical protein VF710_17665 [Longimicrobium sp.]|jgi:hypothetical protein